MALPALIAGGVGLAGALLSYKGKKDANKSNVALAREQMAFQERMSSTAYQRATEDMKLAGINPMLAYAQGGASSPGGQTAKVEDVIGPAVSSAMHLTRLRKEVDMMDAQIFKMGKENIKITNESNLISTQNDLLNYGPPGGPSFAARMKEQDFLYKQAQASALRFSPWLAKLLGTAPFGERPAQSAAAGPRRRGPFRKSRRRN